MSACPTAKIPYSSVSEARQNLQGARRSHRPYLCPLCGATTLTHLSKNQLGRTRRLRNTASFTSPFRSNCHV